MGHQVGPCDFLDVLEEGAVLKRAVLVDLKDGRHFTDTVRDVVTENGEDFVVFHDHGRMALHQLSNARRAQPIEPSYEGKLGQ